MDNLSLYYILREADVSLNQSSGLSSSSSLPLSSSSNPFYSERIFSVDQHSLHHLSHEHTKNNLPILSKLEFSFPYEYQIRYDQLIDSSIINTLSNFLLERILIVEFDRQFNDHSENYDNDVNIEEQPLPLITKITEEWKIPSGTQSIMESSDQSSSSTTRNFQKIPEPKADTKLSTNYLFHHPEAITYWMKLWKDIQIGKYEEKI